jgi:hypothetical protein
MQMYNQEKKDGELRERSEKYAVSLRKNKREDAIKERRKRVQEERVHKRVPEMTRNGSEDQLDENKVSLKEFVLGIS